VIGLSTVAVVVDLDGELIYSVELEDEDVPELQIVHAGKGTPVITHKYRGSQQSLREVKPKFIDSTQGEPKNIYKP
jgi:hypothetical protein